MSFSYTYARIERRKLMLTLKNDLAFRIFFSKKGNEKFLKDFLESILEIKIDNIEISSNFSPSKDFLRIKDSVLDIQAKVNGNLLIDLEMQNQDNHNLEKRMLFYASKLMTSNLQISEDYQLLKPMSLISLLNYNLFDFPEHVSSTITVIKQNTDLTVMDSLEFRFIELPKFRKKLKKEKVINNKLDAWLALIDYSDMELIEMAKSKFKTIEEAIEAYEEITANQELMHYLTRRQIARMDAISRENYIKREFEAQKQRAIKKAIGKATRHGHNQGFLHGRQRGLEQGLKQGIEQGIEQGKQLGLASGQKSSQIEIAKNMLKEGLSFEFISKMTNLSEEEIKNLS